MKNKLLRVTAATGMLLLLLFGSIIYNPKLLPPAQAVTVTRNNQGIIIIGVGRSVRSTENKTYRARKGDKFYFECKDGGDYNYFTVEGKGFSETLASAGGSRSRQYRFPQKGSYRFMVKDGPGKQIDSVEFNVK